MTRLPPLLGLAALALAGCGPAEPALYPVEGTVKFFDGAPADGCIVEFRSEADATKGLNARSEVGPGGVYRLKTVVNGKEKDGAVAGPHAVVVVGPPAGSSGGPAPSVPQRFADYKTSGLAFEVKAQPENTYPIVVDRK